MENFALSFVSKFEGIMAEMCRILGLHCSRYFPFVKFCITTRIPCKKILEVNIWISSSQQDNTENLNYVMCQLYAVFMSTL